MNFNFRLKIFSLDHRISISMKSVQSGIMLVVACISIIVAYWGSATILLISLGLVAGIAGLLILLRYPSLGFIILLLGGMFISFAGPGGFNASILTVILMIFLWLLDMFVVKRNFTIVKSRPIRPAFYMLLVSIIAFAMGQIPWYAFANQAPLDAQFGGFAIYFFLVLAMIMTANILNDIKWLKAIVWIFVVLGIIDIIGIALKNPSMDALFRSGWDQNSMFWMWMVALPLGQAVFNNRLSQRFRVVLYGCVAFVFYVAIFIQTDWKSGWIPGAVVVATLVALKFKKIIPFMIPFAVLAAIYLGRDLIATDQYSWGTRIDAWLIVLNMSRVSPIIGLGFANYYWYAPLFPIRGYSIQFISHSQFVDIIAQTGILGLFCFLWILFEVGWLGWKSMDQFPEGFAKGYAYGVFAGVLGSLMAAFLVDWLLPFAYNIGLDGVRASILPWIFFGGLIGIEQIYRREQNTDPVSLREHRLRPTRS